MCPATFSLGVLRRGGRGINRVCRDQLVKQFIYSTCEQDFTKKLQIHSLFHYYF